MSLRREESEFIFCDLQAVARFIRKHNSDAARAFLDAAYDTFDFLAENPGVGRRRPDLGFDEVRSFRVIGFRRYLVFYKVLSDRIQFWRGVHGSRDLPSELS